MSTNKSHHLPGKFIFSVFRRKLPDYIYTQKCGCVGRYACVCNVCEVRACGGIIHIQSYFCSSLNGSISLLLGDSFHKVITSHPQAFLILTKKYMLVYLQCLNKLCFVHEIFYPKWPLWTFNQTSKLLQQMNTEGTKPLL